MKVTSLIITFTTSILFSIGCQSAQSAARESLKPPLSVLLVGDSMMGGTFGLYLEETLSKRPGFTVHREFMVSSGLSGLHEYSWMEASYEFIDIYKPDIVIVIFGANDSLATKNFAPKVHNVFFADPGFKKAYANKVKLFLDIVSPRVKRIYWIGQPNLEHAQLTAKLPVINEVFAAEVPKYPNTVYIPLWELTSENGKYRSVMKDKDGVSGPIKWDYVHFSPHGARVIGDHILSRIYYDVDGTPIPHDVSETAKKPRSGS